MKKFFTKVYLIFFCTIAFLFVFAPAQADYGGVVDRDLVFEHAAFSPVWTTSQLMYAKHDGANAGGGGQVNNPWQPAPTDICSAFLPAGLDLENCTVISTTSAGRTYLCGNVEEFTVTCPITDDDDDGGD